MDTRKVATEYRLAQWAQIVQTRISTGQSIKAFCATEGISKNTYFYWQRKLREAACEMVTQTSEDGVVGHSGSPMPLGWTRLEASEPCVAAALTIEINGCRITVDSETSPELLSKVCRTLKSL